MTVPKTVHFAHVSCGDESLDIVILDIVHHAGELVGGEEGLDLKTLLAAVTADDLVQGAAALQGFGDVIADFFLMSLRDDADALAAVDRSHEVVQGEAVEPSAHQAEHDQTERIDGEGGTADDGAGDGHGHADVEVQVFVDDFGQDVQAARGGIDAEQDGLRDAHHQDEDDQVHQRVAHHGSQTGLDELFVGAHLLPEFQERTQDHGRVYGLGAEFLADQQPGQDQEDGVDDRDDRGDLDGDTQHREHIREDDGETGDGSQDEFAGHHEVIDGGGRDGHAQGHDEQFLPELPGAEVLQDLFHGVVSFSL